MKFRHRAVIAAALCTSAQISLANSGVQLSLNQYQAGSEVTDSSLITNPGFESVDGNNVPTGWTPNLAPPDNIMIGATPDPANLPNPATVLQTRSAQAFRAGGVEPFNDYKLSQTVTLASNTDYVLSAYIWSYGKSGSPPHDDLFGGDLAVVEVVDPNDSFNSSGLSLEPTALDGSTGSRGFFMYKYFNSSQFPAPQVALEVEFDPNQSLGFENRPALSAQFDNVALTPLTQFVAQRWTNTSIGNWTDPANWVNGPANFEGAVATFSGDVAGGLARVTQEGTVTVGAINFSSNGTYSIQGSGTLLLDHQEARDAVIINVLSGNGEVKNPIEIGVGAFGNPAQIFPRTVKLNVASASGVLHLADPMTAANVGTLGAGTFDVRKLGAGKLETAPIRARQLLIDQGTTRILPGATQSGQVSTLTLAGGATPSVRLELTNSALVVDYLPTEPSPIGLIKSQILAAYAGGSFNGNGIAPGYFSNYGVGYAEAGELASVPPIFGTVDTSAVLLRGTLNGDSNLDGVVDIGDFAILAANFNTLGDWVDGNSNYDALVDIGDFALLAANFNQAVARPAAVPEPAGAAVLVLLLALRRRKSFSQSPFNLAR